MNFFHIKTEYSSYYIFEKTTNDNRMFICGQILLIIFDKTKILNIGQEGFFLKEFATVVNNKLLINRLEKLYIFQ